MGKWEMRKTNVPLIRGYFRGLQTMGHDNWTLIDTSTGKVWMSCTPLETESMMPAIWAAHGNVVVVGLGMGMVAYNMALKPEVNRVVVVERDPEVVGLFNEFAAFTAPEWAEKVTILMADATDFRHRLAMPVDLLYMDIWAGLGEKRAVKDTRAAVQSCDPATVCWWGQELDIVSWLSRRGRRPPITDGDIRSWVTAMNMPILATTIPDYPRLVEAAAMNVVLA